MKKLITAGLIILSLQSCATIKEYEMVNLHDPDMNLSDRDIIKTENSYLIYREGAAGANGGKTGGGCGCN